MTASKKFTSIFIQNPQLHAAEYKIISTFFPIKFVSYEIVLETTNISFAFCRSSVRRRYSEFDWLRKALARNYERCVPELPPKRLFGRSCSKEVVEERIRGLKTFLDRIVMVTAFLDSQALHLFLQSSLTVEEIEECLREVDCMKCCTRINGEVDSPIDSLNGDVISDGLTISRVTSPTLSPSTSYDVISSPSQSRASHCPSRNSLTTPLCSNGIGLNSVGFGLGSDRRIEQHNPSGRMSAVSAAYLGLESANPLDEQGNVASTADAYTVHSPLLRSDPTFRQQALIKAKAAQRQRICDCNEEAKVVSPLRISRTSSGYHSGNSECGSVSGIACPRGRNPSVRFVRRKNALFTPSMTVAKHFGQVMH